MVNLDGESPGIYKFRPALKGKAKINLFGSGPILNEALRAQEMLSERYKVEADVWSVTSYNELRRDCLETERWNRLTLRSPQPNEGVLEWLLACPQKGYFVPIESESTDTL